MTTTVLRIRGEDLKLDANLNNNIIIDLVTEASRKSQVGFCRTIYYAKQYYNIKQFKS